MPHKKQDKSIHVSDAPLSSKLGENKKRLKKAFGHTIDLVEVSVTVAGRDGILLFFSTLVDAKELNKEVAEVLTQIDTQYKQNVLSIEQFETVRRKFLNGLPFKYVHTLHETIDALLEGHVVLLLEGFISSLALSVTHPKMRSIVEPSTQTIVRGPKDSFIESIEVNKGLIRQRLKNSRLRFVDFVIGSETKTLVCIAYLEGVVKEELLKEVKKRLNDIEAVSIIDSGQIEEFITDKAITLFPTTYNTERPDLLTLHILEGKVAILVDGTPFALSVPAFFSDFFQVSEDYYQPFFMSSFVRFVRYLSYFLSLLMPGLYVALTTYHLELIPTPLLVSIIGQRENVPFPAIVELFILETTFEVLREAGVRMPRAVGQTVSIVGALVIGQAAVEAGIVSTVMVIVVALTAIASFVSPIYSFSSSSRLLRFLIAISAAVFGLYGILLILITVVIHLSAIRTFGAPYLAPIAPLITEDQKDVFIRMPTWMMQKGARRMKMDFYVNEQDTTTPIHDYIEKEREKE